MTNGTENTHPSTATKAQTVAAFELPASGLLDPGTENSLLIYQQESAAYYQPYANEFPPWPELSVAQMPAFRRRRRELYYGSPLYNRIEACYPTQCQPETMAGVYTETFTPTAGVPEAQAPYILINIHGGSFLDGSRTSSHSESAPVAALGNIKVISIDYRMAPEHHHPAGRDDIVAVYKALLADYAPEQIGLYGTSAGAVLAAQTIAKLQQENLPLPCAVAMLSAGAFYWLAGDSGTIGPAINGLPPFEYEYEYFKGIAKNDPVAFPGNNPTTMAGFPPSFLASSSRDTTLSSVIQTHRELVRQGVTAELHLWDGLSHMFQNNVELAQSAEFYQLLVGFFDRHFKQLKNVTNLLP